MLTREEIRCKKIDFGALLHHNTFHLSLLTCSTEIIAFTYELQEFQFPKSMKLVNQTNAFEISKLIDNLFIYEKNLPIVIQQHLKHIDQKILQSFIWKEDSVIFELLLKGGKHQEEYLFEKSKERFTKHFYSRDSINSTQTSVHTTPINKKHQLTHHSSYQIQLLSPMKPPGSTFRSSSLEIIFRKLIDLIIHRINQLVNELSHANILDNTVITMIKILTQKYSLLLKNRHLDQIIICTVYGVARALKIDITFRKILQYYKNQWQAEAFVWKKVLIRDGIEKDIIEFYNEIYIVEMEDFLLKFQNSRPTQIPLTGDTNAIILNSPVRVKTVPSPKTTDPTRKVKGLVYNVGQSPVKDLKNYNESSGSILSPNNRKKVARKLLFEEEENPAKKQKLSNDNQPSTDSLVQ